MPKLRHLPLALLFLAGFGAGLTVRDTTAPRAQAASGGHESTPAAVDTADAGGPPGRLRLGTYAAGITRVIDGDTVEARVAVWMGQEVVTKIRLRGIDAPEIRGTCGTERDRAIAARDALAALVAQHPVTISDIGPDKYFGRVVARVLAHDGRDAGAALMAAGLARPYGGGRRDGWCGVP